jgi:hypothetical protein
LVRPPQFFTFAPPDVRDGDDPERFVAMVTYSARLDCGDAGLRESFAITQGDEFALTERERK